MRPIPLYLSLRFLLFVLLAVTPPASLFQFDDASTLAVTPTARDKPPTPEKLELQMGLPQWLGASFVQQLIVSFGAGSSGCEIIIDQGKLRPKISVRTTPEGLEVDL